MDLTDTQFERYARHLILDEVGEEGQARLLSSRSRVQVLRVRRTSSAWPRSWGRWLLLSR